MLPMNVINAVVIVPLHSFPSNLRDLESLGRVSTSDFSTAHDADWWSEEMTTCAERSSNRGEAL